MPLSRDERKRRRQLANLQPAPPAPAGNSRAITHGGYAAVAVERLQDRERQVYEALAGDAPLRAPGDHSPTLKVPLDLRMPGLEYGLPIASATAAASRRTTSTFSFDIAPSSIPPAGGVPHDPGSEAVRAVGGAMAERLSGRGD